MKLTFALNDIEKLVWNQQGYEAIHAMFQLAHSYSVNVDELEELVYEGSIKHSIQTIICGKNEERMDAIAKLMGGQAAERERLYGLNPIELRHYFYLLLRELQQPLELEFDKAIDYVAVRLTRLLEERYRHRGYEEEEAEEETEELERLLFDLTHASIDIEEFRELHERFDSLVNLNRIIRYDPEMCDYLGDVWSWMDFLEDCISYLKLDCGV